MNLVKGNEKEGWEISTKTSWDTVVKNQRLKKEDSNFSPVIDFPCQMILDFAEISDF